MNDVIVHIVIGCGGDGSGSLVSDAHLAIEGVYSRYEDAWRASSAGDQEVHSFTVAESLGGDTHELRWQELPATGLAFTEKWRDGD